MQACTIFKDHYVSGVLQNAVSGAYTVGLCDVLQNGRQKSKAMLCRCQNGRQKSKAMLCRCQNGRQKSKAMLCRCQSALNNTFSELSGPFRIAIAFIAFVNVESL